MTESHRDFDAEAAKTTTSEPSGTFTLGGREWHVRNRDDVSLGFRKAFLGDGNVLVEAFFRATIIPAEIDAFVEMIDTPDGPLTTRNVSGVIDHVTELVTGRPTVPAGSSAAGSKRTGSKSTAGSSSQGTRRRQSA